MYGNHALRYDSNDRWGVSKMLDAKISECYLRILEEELVPAMGCTEPIALAYAAAKAREILGEAPVRAVAKCSGNMIKNVRCVTIPHSGGMSGIEAGVTLGAVGGNPEKSMEVLEDVTPEQIERTKRLLAEGFCQVELLESPIPLHIQMELYGKSHQVMLEIQHSHTHITQIVKDGQALMGGETAQTELSAAADRSLLNVEDIKAYADTAGLAPLRPLLDRQISCNMAISREGMTGKYGLGIGKVIQESCPDCVGTKIKARTAAASEARMGGCDLPVIINSGSGNQGIASSVPVVVYAEEKGLGQEKLYRALVFSNLLTIYQKTFIGKLSAFCGAVSASCSSGAALTYLAGGSLEAIKMTIANTLADVPGILCDGAKVSCAAKIASSLDAAMMAHHLAMRGKVYAAHTGILKEDTSETVSCVGHIGREGMRETDREILKIMLG